MRWIARLVWLMSIAMASGALAQDIPPTPCDRLAGDPYLPRVADLPGPYRILEPAEAIAACQAARAEFPAEPRFALFLARALNAENPYSAEPAELLAGVIHDLPALATGWLGDFYAQGGAGAAAGDAQARSYYQQSCELGAGRASARGCTGLAVMMIEGRGGEANEPRGFELLSAQCSLGWGPACLDLALQAELRGDNTPERVVALLDTACIAGELYACALFGFRLEIGEGVLPDAGRAIALYRRACEGGEAEGCTNLGAAYQQGVGVVPDLAEAARLFDLGCQRDDPFACMSLGDMLEEGRGVAVDIRRAAQVFERACAWGDPEACDRFDALR